MRARLFGRIFGRKILDKNHSAFYLFGIPMFFKTVFADRTEVQLFKILLMHKRSHERQSIADVFLHARLMRIQHERNFLLTEKFDPITKLPANYNQNRRIRVLYEMSSTQVTLLRGIGVYNLNLLKELSKHEELDITLLFDKNENNCELWKTNEFLAKFPRLFVNDLDHYNGEIFDFLFLGHIYYPFYYQTLFFPRMVCLFKSTVGVCHDLIPSIFRGTYPSEKGTLERLLSASLVDYAFTNSQCTSDDLTRFLEYPKDKVTTIYGGIDSEKLDIIGIPKPYDPKTRSNDLVAVMGGDQRKNVTGTAIAFVTALNNGKIPSDSRLVIASYLEGKYEKIKKEIIKTVGKDFDMKKHIIIFDKHRPTDKEIVDFISNARATVFASFYEGLGLPILESYAANTPCITSSVSSMAELAPVSCQFDVFDNDKIIDKIIEVYNNHSLCKESVEFGNKLISDHCNWKIAAKKVKDKLLELSVKKSA